MKWLIVCMLTLFLLFGCGQQKPAESGDSAAAETETALLQKADPVGKYGKAITLSEKTTIKAILEQPETFQGKTVLVEGTVVDVCPKRGCWIEMAGGEEFESIRVKVKDGEIVFPLSARGSHAVVEGTVERLELPVKKARAWKAHMAEEKGEVFDTTTITEPLVIWRLRGHGAEITG